LLDRVERFRKERQSGRDVYPWMTPIEWEALILWDETIEQCNRDHEIRVAQLFELIASRFAIA
jgi:hypothetical protein